MAIEIASPVSSIVRLQAADLVQLESLLQTNGLPTDDCADQLDALFGLFDAGQLIAAGGLEAAGADAWLRSIVVAPTHRCQGLAARLTEFLIDDARSRNLRGIYLLTETADDYFMRFGFAEVERSIAPQMVQKTRQFAGLCPGSATFMRLLL